MPRMRCILLPSLLLLASWAATDPTCDRGTQPAPEPVLLSPGSVKTTSMRPFSWMGSAQCDANSNTYWHSGYEYNPKGPGGTLLAG